MKEVFNDKEFARLMADEYFYPLILQSINFTSKRLKMILWLRFEMDYSLEEVAKKLFLCRSRVRDLEIKALKQLKTSMGIHTLFNDK